MSIGFWQIIIIVLLLVLLFGRGKISDLMGDVAKGIKSFKKGMAEDEQEEETAEESEPKVIEHASEEPVAKTQAEAKGAAKAKAPRKRKAS
ncbi:MAG TPA: twin-arginine translocase TatA/TatE family subunit [Hyphomicrobiales bacterium]|nr:twin-arginine translocase TatA/TatE family subunit [Hyphomicrobiales bacterium]